MVRRWARIKRRTSAGRPRREVEAGREIRGEVEGKEDELYSIVGTIVFLELGLDMAANTVRSISSTIMRGLDKITPLGTDLCTHSC